jgi:hypothetical protein
MVDSFAVKFRYRFGGWNGSKGVRSVEPDLIVITMKSPKLAKLVVLNSLLRLVRSQAKLLQQKGLEPTSS